MLASTGPGPVIDDSLDHALEVHYGAKLHRAEQHLRAVPAGLCQATLLEAPARSALLKLERLAIDNRNQPTVAKLALAKDVDDFAFQNTPINEVPMCDLVGGGFITRLRNVVLVGGTDTGKSHLAVAVARSCVRAGSGGRFFTTVDLARGRKPR
jgi:DNA replication protein DnaC